MTAHSVEHEVRGLRFPEGPIALPDGSVLLVEIERGTLTRVEPDGTVEVVADCGGGPVPGDPMVTNVCFGGPGLRTAYITASGFGTLVAHEWHCPGLPLNGAAWQAEAVAAS